MTIPLPSSTRRYAHPSRAFKICARCQVSKPRADFGGINNTDRACLECLASETKRCSICREHRPLSEYYQRHDNGRPRAACIDCIARTRPVTRSLGNRSRGKACRECEGMPWRRDPVFGCVCGGQYAEEGAVTLDERAAERPGAGATWPEGMA